MKWESIYVALLWLSLLLPEPYQTYIYIIALFVSLFQMYMQYRRGEGYSKPKLFFIIIWLIFAFTFVYKYL